jgi:hypothetical protein
MVKNIVTNNKKIKESRRLIKTQLLLKNGIAEESVKTFIAQLHNAFGPLQKKHD